MTTPTMPLVNTIESKPKEPYMIGEIFLSLVKWFFVILIINNLIWACVHYGYFAKSFSGTSMEVTQDGTNNNQSVTNG